MAVGLDFYKKSDRLTSMNTKPFVNVGFVKRGHIATVQNNPAGRQFIAALRKTLKAVKKTEPTFSFKVQVYGRGHRYGKGRSHVIRTADGNYIPKPGTHGWDNSYQSSLPHRLAERLAVYVS